MKFSCIMTTFNDGELIQQSIASVLNQSYGDFELILVDDGSSQPTIDILATFNDSRIKLLPQANDGLSSARNRGLHHARGEYVCFLDADDTRAPWSFDQAANAIKATRPDLILVSGISSFTRTRLEPFMDHLNLTAMEEEVSKAGAPLTIEARKAWATSFEPQSANKFIARRVIEQGKLRFPNNHFFEDILFHVLTVAHAQSIEFLKTPGFTYFQRQFRQQLTESNGQIRFDILGTAQVAFQIFEKHNDFRNVRQRGAVSIGALRLLRWCEQKLPIYHKHSFRLSLREMLQTVSPLYLVIDETTPDPRREREGLLHYAREVMA
jgi:glycosyltransferase involved in cell wall biosynthesis